MRDFQNESHLNKALQKGSKPSRGTLSPLVGAPQSDGPMTRRGDEAILLSSVSADIKPPIGGDPVLGTKISKRVGKGLNATDFDPDVLIVQFYLSQNGYLSSDQVNGILNDETLSKIKAFHDRIYIEGRITAAECKDYFEPGAKGFEILVSEVVQKYKTQEAERNQREYQASYEGQVKNALQNSNGNPKVFAKALADIAENNMLNRTPFFKNIPADDFFQDLRLVIDFPDIISQSINSLCGPAMMSRTFTSLDPVGMASVAIALYLEGKADYKDLHMTVPREVGDAPYLHWNNNRQIVYLTPFEFVVLSAIRNHGNGLTTYVPGEHEHVGTGSTLEKLEGFTWPIEPFVFYRNVGLNCEMYPGALSYVENVIHRTVLNPLDLTKSIADRVVPERSLSSIKVALDSWAKVVQQGGKVDLLIHSGVINRTNDWYVVPNHYISFHDYTENKDGTITFRYWNYGQIGGKDGTVTTTYLAIANGIDKVYVVTK